MSHRFARLIVSSWLALCPLTAIGHAADPAPPPSAPDGSQPAPDGAHPTLSEVLVTAQRARGRSVNVAEFPGNATVITSQQIAESGHQSIPELLRGYEGVTMMDFSGFGLGADATVNLRGVVNSSRNGSLVRVNGVRQNGVVSDDVHWQGIPISQVERIEIIRGGSGISYGEGGLSGVINVILKEGGERPLEAEQGVEFGSYGQARYTVSARGASGPWSYGTSYQRSDVSGYRESTNARTTSLTNHLGWEVLPGLQISTNVLHSEDTTYFSGGITPAASQARRRQSGALPGFNDNRHTQLSLNTSVEGPFDTSLSVDAFWKWRDSNIISSFGTFATIAPSRGLTLSASHEAGRDGLRHTLVGGVDLIDEKASTGTRGGTFSESNKEGYGLFIEETLRLADRASLVAGLRFDKLRFAEDLTFPAFVGTLRFEGWSPKLGASVDLSDSLTVYGNFARPFKSPNVFDFAVSIPFGFLGNVTLQEQQGEEYELGVRLDETDLGRAKMAWFHSRIDDEILFNSAAFRSENFDTSRTGVELAVEPALPIPHLTSLLSYTFLETEFRKGTFKENTLPGVPEHQFRTLLTYEPVPDLVLLLDWIVVHDFFRINDFTNSLPGDNYGILNVGARYTYRGVTFHFHVENLTNQEYTSFQSSTGTIVSTGENPAPPISFRAGATVRF